MFASSVKGTQNIFSIKHIKHLHHFLHIKYIKHIQCFLMLWCNILSSADLMAAVILVFKSLMSVTVDSCSVQIYPRNCWFSLSSQQGERNHSSDRVKPSPAIHLWNVSNAFLHRVGLIFKSIALSSSKNGILFRMKMILRNRTHFPADETTKSQVSLGQTHRWWKSSVKSLHFMLFYIKILKIILFLLYIS